MGTIRKVGGFGHRLAIGGRLGQLPKNGQASPGSIMEGGNVTPQSARTAGESRQRVPLLLMVTAIIVLTPTLAYAQNGVPREKTWEPNGTVTAIATTPTTVYVGGSFDYVGPNTGSGVSIDATTGMLPDVFPKVIGNVSVCVADGLGGWYIGGTFTKVGSAARNNIAHILADGAVDSAWDPNASRNWWETANVRSLTVSGKLIYVGGYFTDIGGRPRRNIAALDTVSGLATDWNPNATGGNEFFGETVRSMVVSNGIVYIGGTFTRIGGQARNGVAALDEITGLATPWASSSSGGTHDVFALAISGNTVYVGGEFDHIGGQFRYCLAALDASTGLATAWNPLRRADGPYVPRVVSMAISGDTMYVAGAFTTIDGAARTGIAALDLTTASVTSWNPGPAVNSSGVPAAYVIVVSGNKVFVGGSFTNIGGESRYHVAALDSTDGSLIAWNPTTEGPVATLAVSGNDIYTGGWFSRAGGKVRSRLFAMDATTGMVTDWNPNVVGLSVTALAAANNLIYAGGNFSEVGGEHRSAIAALDASTGMATAWNPYAVCGASRWPHEDPTVNALIVSGNVIYAGGAFDAIGGQTRRNIAALDATTGAVTTCNPYAEATVEAVAISDKQVYAAWMYQGPSSIGENHFGSFDAVTGVRTAWNPYVSWGSHYSSTFEPDMKLVTLHFDYTTVYSAFVSGNAVYIGGDFTLAGGQNRNNIAALDTTTGIATVWNPNANGIVRALTLAKGSMCVGGYFTKLGGQSRKGIGSVDATSGAVTTWDPGVEGPVYAVAVSGNRVYVGGDFNSVGGLPQSNLAQFEFNCDIDGDGSVDAADVQLAINAALGLDISGDADMDHNGKVNAVEIQAIINEALGIH